MPLESGSARNDFHLETQPWAYGRRAKPARYGNLYQNINGTTLILRDSTLILSPMDSITCRAVCLDKRPLTPVPAFYSFLRNPVAPFRLPSAGLSFYPALPLSSYSRHRYHLSLYPPQFRSEPFFGVSSIAIKIGILRAYEIQRTGYGIYMSCVHGPRLIFEIITIPISIDHFRSLHSFTGAFRYPDICITFSSAPFETISLSKSRAAWLPIFRF